MAGRGMEPGQTGDGGFSGELGRKNLAEACIALGCKGRVGEDACEG